MYRLSSLLLACIVPLHPKIQSLTQLIEKVRPALVLSALHIQIGVVAMPVLNFHAEVRAEESRQFFYVVLSVVDAAQLVKSVDDFDQLNKAARPAERGCLGFGFRGG